jgi:hypothetical protein
VLLGCVVGAAAMLILLLRACRCKGTPSQQASRVRDFVVWALIVLQTISQTATITAGTVPGSQAVYGALRMLQSEGIIEHPACLHGPPFQMQLVSLGLLLLLLLVVCISTVSTWLFGAIWGMNLLFLAYSSVSNMSLVLVRCHTVVLSSSVAALLDGRLRQPEHA